MKKIFSLITVGLVTISIAACSTAEDNESTDQDSATISSSSAATPEQSTDEVGQWALTVLDVSSWQDVPADVPVTNVYVEDTTLYVQTSLDRKHDLADAGFIIRTFYDKLSVDQPEWSKNLSYLIVEGEDGGMLDRKML